MKFGIRKPNLKKRVKARTTGRMKRSVKKSVNPLYGKKGMGWAKNPKRAAYNKVYNKTSVGLFQGKKGAAGNKSMDANNIKASKKTNGMQALGCIGLIISIFIPPLFIASLPFYIYAVIKSNKEKKQKRKEAEEAQVLYEKQVEFLEMFQELDRIFKKAEKTEKVDTFFKNYEEGSEYFSIIENALKQENQVATAEEVLKTREEFVKKRNEILKAFIKRYEEASFEKATRLKTEKGQRNNYQRSLEDLNEYSDYFDEDIKSYIEERWQEI